MKTEQSKKTMRTTVYLPKNLHAELRIEAIKQGISMTELVIRAVQRELNTTTGNITER